MGKKLVSFKTNFFSSSCTSCMSFLPQVPSVASCTLGSTPSAEPSISHVSEISGVFFFILFDPFFPILAGSATASAGYCQRWRDVKSEFPITRMTPVHVGHHLLQHSRTRTHTERKHNWKVKHPSLDTYLGSLFNETPCAATIFVVETLRPISSSPQQGASCWPLTPYYPQKTPSTKRKNCF